LFRRKKQETQPESKTPAVEQPISNKKMPDEQLTAKEANVEKPTIEAPPTATPTPSISAEKTGEEAKTYLKAMPLRELTDLDAVENEVRNGNIVILRITPLASKSITDVKQAVDQLYAFAESIHGDIARLGEERVVVCPANIRIWREKTPVQKTPSLLPTAA
jgi:SepF-like predicted cell division protein (DUF552 family)